MRVKSAGLRERDRRRAKARHRAMSKLACAHPAEYLKLYQAELEDQGIAEIRRPWHNRREERLT